MIWQHPVQSEGQLDIQHVTLKPLPQSMYVYTYDASTFTSVSFQCLIALHAARISKPAQVSRCEFQYIWQCARLLLPTLPATCATTK